jgi:TNF receptor-associated factor 3
MKINSTTQSKNISIVSRLAILNMVIFSDSLMHSLTRVDRIESDIANLNDRYLKADYNVKQLTNTVNETEDKSEKLEKQVTMCKELVYETKQRLEDLEEHLKVQRQFNMITNLRGHLIWKINNYSKKLNDAKESDVPLKSPLFSNKHCKKFVTKLQNDLLMNLILLDGYALRLDVHLNGIGTWKNRNMIACLTVVNGDFDTLLSWPCKLKADIILRDQPDDLSQATDITKLVITKKRNDRFEYQNQFIHIPHQVINRLCTFSSPV